MESWFTGEGVVPTALRSHESSCFVSLLGPWNLRVLVHPPPPGLVYLREHSCLSVQLSLKRSCEWPRGLPFKINWAFNNTIYLATSLMLIYSFWWETQRNVFNDCKKPG